MEEDTSKAEEQETIIDDAPVAEEKSEPSTEEVLANPEMKALIESFDEKAEAPKAEESEEEAEAEESDEEPAAEEEASEESEEEPEAWVQTRDRRLAQALGLSDEELSDFGSRTELEQFAHIYTATQKKNEATPAKEEAKVEYVDAPFLADGSVNVEWYKEHDYDEGQIALAQKHADNAKVQNELKQQVEQLTSLVANQHRNTDLDKFHDALDALDGEFYGKTMTKEGPVSISDKLGRRRTDVFDQLPLAAESLTKKLGKQPTMAQMVTLAAELAHKEQLAELAQKRSEAAKKGTLTKIAKQAQKVRPVGGHALTTPNRKMADQYSPEWVMQQPEMVAMLASFHEENAN